MRPLSKRSAVTLPYSPDAAKPSTWIRYRPSLCEGCQAGCCTLPVEVTASDLLRMGLISLDESQGSLKKAAKRLKREGLTANFRAKTGLFILTQKEGGACIMLGPDRRCTIYENRPEVCRKFPLELSPRKGFCPAKPRPIAGKTRIV